MERRPSSYTTKQGEAILAYLKAQDGKHLTAGQIAEHFGRGEGAIGRTTVYRQLDKLVRKGQIRKYILDESPGASFQYIDETECGKEHFHLKCDGCGKLIHMKNGAAPCVEQDILASYMFEVDVSKTVFYGKCRTCSGRT